MPLGELQSGLALAAILLGTPALADDLTEALAPMLNACTMPDLSHAERIAAFGPDARALKGDEKLAALKPMVFGADLGAIANELLAKDKNIGMPQVAANLASLTEDTRQTADLAVEGYLKGSDVLALGGDVDVWIISTGGTKSVRSICYLSLPEATTMADLEVILKPAISTYPFDFGQYIGFNISPTDAPFLVEAIIPNAMLVAQSGLPFVFLQIDDVTSKP